MKRIFILSSLALVGMATVLAGTSQKRMLSEKDIPHRKTATTLISAERISDRITVPHAVKGRTLDASLTDSPSYGPHAIMKAVRSGQECVDSIIRFSLDGDRISKQSFTYTAEGLPLACQSLLPYRDSDDWYLYTTYGYEYDDLQRMVQKYSTNPEDPYVNVKYDYFYSDDSSNYTEEVYYYYEDGDYVPGQKGEYAYDEAGRLTMQIFAYFDPYAWEWINVNKQTYSWDNAGRQTSYFYYEWNPETQAWVGSVMNGDCEEYFYTDSGADSLIRGYVWEDGKWFNFSQKVYQYNEKGQCVKEENLYWNRAANDWAGGDAWGPFEQIYNNALVENSYDDSGRLILQNVYSVRPDGERVLTTVFERNLTDLGEGNTEIEETLSLKMTADTDPAPWNTSLIRTNRFGSEYYYMGFSYPNGVKTATSEQLRHMDEYNNFLGAEYYGFNTAGNRYGQSKEQFNYASDFNPALGFETPSEGIHWVGTSQDSDDSWALTTRDTFEWINGTDIMYASENFIYSSEGEEFPMSYYAIDYDTSVLMNGNIWFWRDYTLNEDYYRFKVLAAEAGANWDYEAGDKEWDANVSYIDEYYYGVFATTSVTSVSDPEAVETARYSTDGVRLQSAAKGLNIVVYSDGSTKKEWVR